MKILYVVMLVVITILIGVGYASIEHYKYCIKIQYLEDNGYVKHKLTVGYKDRYILCFIKGNIEIHEHELFNLTLKQLKEKYR